MIDHASFNFGIGFFIFGWLFFSSIIAFAHKCMTHQNKSRFRVFVSVVTIAATCLGMLFYMITALPSNICYCILSSIICATALSLNIIIFVKDLSTAVKKEFHINN